MLIGILCFIGGLIIGIFIGYTYDYYKHIKEFEERQKRYRRLL